MKTIVFNSIQVTNYWFTLHRTLGFLYQQAQTFSSNIWGISDQDVTDNENNNDTDENKCVAKLRKIALTSLLTKVVVIDLDL